MSKIYDMLTGVGISYSTMDLYPDTVLKQYEKDIADGKIKRWTELGSKKECEKARKELSIRIAKIDKMPALKEELEELYGRLLHTYYEQIELLNECVYRMNKLHKLQTKKNFTYKDTYKLDNLFEGDAPVNKKLKFSKESSEKQFLGYLDQAILRKDKEFLSRVIISMQIGGVSINEKK